MKRCNTVEAGFTFLELLIVFSVISILTIMLFPSVHKLKQQSRQATCINNHRQLAIASILYANESMEKLPVDLVKLSTGNYLVPAPQILPEETNFFSSTAYASPTMNTFYNNQYDLLKCPEVEGSIFDSPPVHSYGFNVFITGMRVDLIESATTTVMITDSFFRRFPVLLRLRFAME
ncbi:MAG: hypothetical protein H7A34_01425 [bacterium]|nr:hypothetical protein [bacterium]